MTHGGFLVQVATSDGIYLHGYYSPAENKKACVLHIHGFDGNFYQDDYINVLEQELGKSGIGFLTVNTRGCGKNTSFKTIEGRYRRIGTRYELLEDAHLDITAWVKFLIEDSTEEIILAGHSLGTMKVVRYLFEGELKDRITRLILLAPFDKKGLIAPILNKDMDALRSIADKISDTGGGPKTRSSGFGPVSTKTFLSWYRQDDLGRMFEFCNEDYDFPILEQIKVPTLIVVGSKDEFFHLSNPDHPEEAMSILLKHISNSRGKIIENSDHAFRSYENAMAREVAEFLNS
ncbi:MAG: alpha/beta hydrolase [Patescibacteria group bacterium]|jgi:pimeloyl-ACP methyl ester carboxylesterase